MMQRFQNQAPEEAVRELNVLSLVSRRLRGEITTNMRADGVDKVKEDFPHCKRRIEEMGEGLNYSKENLV